MKNIKSLFNIGDKYSRDGYFILDTEIRGNSNKGHEFSSEWIEGNHWSDQPKGVIGPELTEDERFDLIEFLKTL